MSTTLPVGVSRVVGRRLTPEPERELPTDPVKWVRDDLDGFLWSKQREVLRALTEHRKVAVQSCHQIGKTACAAMAGAWWIAAHPPSEAMIVTTAPSGDQVKGILWGELLKAHRKGSLPGSITTGGSTPEWKVNGEQIGFGRKPNDYVDLNKARTQFQGIHARYLLGILDEGCGIPKWLFEAMDTLATNEMSRLLVIGNPDDPTTEFARKCAPGSGWHVISISAFDSPNFTGEPVPEQLRESLISRRWVEDTARDYGEDSPYYISKVLGQFPEVADDVIISPRLVREAHERDLSGQMIGATARFGMDVAREGKDESCIYEERGGVIRLVQAWPTNDLTVLTDAGRALLESKPASTLTLDATGMGWGVHDPLAAEGLKVRPFVAGAAAQDPTRFVNATAEAWWALREAMEAGLIDLDPDDDKLAAQLQSRKWRMDPSQRRIMVERKEEMAKRGMASPDRADAAVIAWYEGVHVPNPDVVLRRNEPYAPPRTSITGDLLDLKT